MGTSSSFRAPPRPRWQAFVAALVGGASLERVRSELFNAGDDWQEALGSPAVASFAATLYSLHDELPARIESSPRIDLALIAAIRDAKSASLEVGFSAASAIAERAFSRVLLSTVQGAADLSGDAPHEGADRWRAQRGDTATALVASYLGEVVGQYARHAVDREAGRLASAAQGAAASGQATEALARRATEIGTAVALASLGDGRPTAATWSQAIDAAFASGRQLPDAAS